MKNKNEPDDAIGVGGSNDIVVVDVAACTAQALAQGRADDGTYVLEPGDVFVHSKVPASGSIKIKLPRRCRETRGIDYHIMCVTDGGGTGVNIEDQDDAIVTAKNYTAAGNGQTAVGDEVILRDTGAWYSVIKSVLT